MRIPGGTNFAMLSFVFVDLVRYILLQAFGVFGSKRVDGRLSTRGKTENEEFWCKADIDTFAKDLGRLFHGFWCHTASMTQLVLGRLGTGCATATLHFFLKERILWLYAK